MNNKILLAAAVLALTVTPIFAIPGANAQSPAQAPQGELLFSQAPQTPTTKGKSAAKAKKKADPKAKAAAKSKKGDAKVKAMKKATAKKKAATPPPS